MSCLATAALTASPRRLSGHMGRLCQESLNLVAIDGKVKMDQLTPLLDELEKCLDSGVKSDPCNRQGRWLWAVLRVERQRILLVRAKNNSGRYVRKTDVALGSLKQTMEQLRQAATDEQWQNYTENCLPYHLNDHRRINWLKELRHQNFGIR